MTDNPLPTPTTAQRNVNLAPLGAVVLLAAAIFAFVVQNSDSQPVKWLFFDGSAATWLVIVISAVAGAALERLVVWTVHRRRHDRHDRHD